MSATWDSKTIKTTPVTLDELLLIDTEDGRNQKRATLGSFGIGIWSRNAGSGFIFPSTLTDKIGIGTTSPTDALTIGAGEGDTTSTLRIQTDDGDKIHLSQVNGSKIALSGGFGFDLFAGTPTSNIGFFRWLTGSPGGFIEKMRLIQNGNLGIGLIDPLVSLHIRSSLTGPIVLDGDADDLIIENNGNTLYNSPPTVTISPPPTPITATATAVLESGVTSIAVTAGGNSYTSTPDVSITGGGGINAAATAILASGVTFITVTNGGTGYVDATTTVSITGGGGTGATADAVVTGASVLAINIINPGTGYTSVPTVTINSSGGGIGATGIATVSQYVNSINITNVGTGYTSTPAVSITGGGGTGATAVATVSQYVISITINLAGSGYVTTPTISITGGGGTGATATAALVNTEVAVITVDTIGSGYTSVPTVTLTAAPSPVNATATAVLTADKVTSITITNAGIGYRRPPPAVTFTGGAGNGVGVNDIVVANSSIVSITVTAGGTGLSLVSNPGQVGVLAFDHANSIKRHGSIVFDHSSERMRFIVDGMQGLLIDSKGHVAVSQDNVEHTQLFTVDTDVLNVPVRMLIRDSVDRLMLGYNGVDAFVTNATQAQVIVPKDTGDLIIATRGNFASNLIFQTSAGTSLVEAMRIDKDGKVGLGLSDPDNLLHVKSGGSIQIGAKNNAGGNRAILDSGGSLTHTFGFNDGVTTGNNHGRYLLSSNTNNLVEAGNDSGGLLLRTDFGRWGGIISRDGSLVFHVNGTSNNLQGYIGLSSSEALLLSRVDLSATFKGDVKSEKRILNKKGTDAVSASELVLNNDGDSYDVTGTTTINTISGTGWVAGNEIELQFDGILTITNNSGGTNDIITADGNNIITTPGFVLGLRFNGTDWIERYRNTVTAGGALLASNNTWTGTNTFNSTISNSNGIIDARGNNVVNIYSITDFPTAVSSVITLAANTTYRLQNTITTSNRFVFSTNTELTSDSVLNHNMIYTGTGTFLSTGAGVSSVFISDILFVGAVPNATALNIAGSNILSIQNSTFFNFTTLGTISDWPSAFINIARFVGYTTGLTYNNCVLVSNSFVEYSSATSIPSVRSMIRVTGNKSSLIQFRFANPIPISPMSVFFISPTIKSNASVTINGVGNIGNGPFFEVGTTGSITAFGSADIPSVAVTSVTDNSGTAVFTTTAVNFLSLNDLVIQSAFSEGTYNGTFIVSKIISTTQYEVQLNGVNVAFVATGTGGVIHKQVLVTSSSHGLALGTPLEITGSTFYNGFHDATTVFGNSFVIQALFVSTQTGTWDTASLDETDPRLKLVDNGAQKDSMITAEANFLNTTGQTVTINTIGVAEKIGTTLWTGNNLERATLATNGVVTYTGISPKNILVNFSATISRSGGGSPTLGIGIGLFKNGVLISGFEFTRLINSGNVQVSSSKAISMVTNDTLEIVVINFDNTTDINVFQANMIWDQAS